MYFQTTVAEIWSALLSLFDLLKNAACIPCPINNNFELEASLRQYTPAAIHWPTFDPVTIYWPLGWSNWHLGVDINHFEAHCSRPTCFAALPRELS